MTSPDFKPSLEQPPGYNTIAPYAPPDQYPPVAQHLATTGASPGSELLAQINQLSIREKFKVSQGWGRSFDVLNSDGQRIFQAEQSAHFCGPVLDVNIRDNSGNEVMEFIDTCKCSCSREMEVYWPRGFPVGYVTLHWNQMVTHMSIMNSAKQTVLLIIGPSFRSGIFGNSCFEVKSTDEQHVVGVIRHENESFSVSFPLDLEVAIKAVLLGASFYLDAIIYQQRRRVQQQQQRRRRT
ncbi:phospholipid scramblase 2 [Xenopus tropicalis]|nr:phospholipid scramblase 2 [Xenopus tropicalis]